MANLGKAGSRFLFGAGRKMIDLVFLAFRDSLLAKNESVIFLNSLFTVL